MTLGLEICNRYETNVINTAHDALRLADDIGADNVTIHLDTYHMNIEEDDLVRPVYEVGDRLGYVHIGENHRGYLGSGHLDLQGFFHALADISYTGPDHVRVLLLRGRLGRRCPTTWPSGATCGTTAPTWPDTRTST